MASIPQQQITDAYHALKYSDTGRVHFGRGYQLVRDFNDYALYHYGTLIYACNMKDRSFSVGGWSRSDADAINSMAYWTGIGGAYIQNYTLYPVGKGPRYEKVAKKRAVRRK